MVISPGENARAIVVMVHGLGEHIRRYGHVADMFKEAGIGFMGLDLPGHGKSSGRRGHIKSYSVMKEMIDILLKSSSQTFPVTPVFLYGHSLGGGIVLEYILKNKPRIKGAIVTSPFLKLAFEPPKSKLVLASVMRYIIPGLVQPSGLNADHISQDRDVVEKYKSDPLVHDKISVSLFDSAMKASAYSLSTASELNIPLLLLHGSGDMITSPEGSRLFASKNSKTTLKIFEGGYHELHNEPFKREVFDFILNWMSTVR
jgi:alpha-beta hydrolase superfamily lysophospholipase